MNANHVLPCSDKVLSNFFSSCLVYFWVNVCSSVISPGVECSTHVSSLAYLSVTQFPGLFAVTCPWLIHVWAFVWGVLLFKKTIPERDRSYFTRIKRTGMSKSIAWRSAALRAILYAALLALVFGGPRPEHRTTDHPQREQADWNQRVQYPALNDAQRVQYPSLHDTQQVQFPSVDDGQVKRNIIVYKYCFFMYVCEQKQVIEFDYGWIVFLFKILFQFS